MIDILLPLLSLMIITWVVIEIRYKPRLDKANGRLVIWYNISGYSRERDFIYLK